MHFKGLMTSKLMSLFSMPDWPGNIYAQVGCSKCTWARKVRNGWPPFTCRHSAEKYKKWASKASSLLVAVEATNLLLCLAAQLWQLQRPRSCSVWGPLPCWWLTPLHLHCRVTQYLHTYLARSVLYSYTVISETKGETAQANISIEQRGEVLTTRTGTCRLKAFMSNKKFPCAPKCLTYTCTWLWAVRTTPQQAHMQDIYV